MSNPTVSFRISDYHLARGLRAIRNIEPSWNLTTPSNLIRTIFNDYIAKSEAQNNTSLDVSPELLHEIILARAGLNKDTNNQLDILPQIAKPKQKTEDQIRQELEEEKIFNQIKHDAKQTQVTEETKLSHKPSEEPKTDSIKSSVTDFSPPSDWME